MSHIHGYNKCLPCSPHQYTAARVNCHLVKHHNYFLVLEIVQQHLYKATNYSRSHGNLCFSADITKVYIRKKMHPIK